MPVNRTEKPNTSADVAPALASPDFTKYEGEVVHFKNGSFHWTALRDIASGLLDPTALDGAVIKESPAKRVTVCEWHGTRCYVKRYRHDWHRFRPYKFYFKRSQARREWETARILARWSLPIVRHIAVGERWSKLHGLRESILITEEFPGIPLSQLADSWDLRLEAFLTSFHHHGVLQRDLHPGNILVDPATRELRLVDLYGIEIRKRLTPKSCQENLARLQATFPFSEDPAVIQRGREIRRALHAKRRWRCLKTNRDFRRIRKGGAHWHARFQWVTEGMGAVLERPDSLLTDSVSLLKNGRSTTVGGSDRFVLKRHNDRGPWQRCKDIFRGGKARQAFVKAYHLELSGVATARPIAAGTRYRLGFPKTGYFLMERLQGATSLHRLPAKPGHLVRPLADLIASFHKEGFSHRDLKLSNFMVDTDGKVFLVDLEGLRFVRRVSVKQARADLARLQRSASSVWGLTIGDYLTFLKHYGSASGIDPRALLKR